MEVLMLSHLLLELSILYSELTFCQNLVPNPSFEIGDCSTGGGQIQMAIPWTSPTSASPDYLKPCNTDSNFTAPINGVGYQEARSGNSYAHFATFSSNFVFREYIQVPLIKPLKNGKPYQLVFYLSLPENDNYASDKVGAFFSNGPVFATNHNGILPYLPQVENNSTNPLSSDSTWIKVEGCFIANGGEDYLTIGNFQVDSLSNVRFIGGGIWDYASYYIDDISLIDMSLAGNDTVICPGGIAEIGSSQLDGITYSWHPTDGLNKPNLANPSASPLKTTTYHLISSNQFGCSSVDTVVVFVAEIDAGKDTSICDGDSLFLGSTSNLFGNFSWTPSSNVSNANAPFSFGYPINSETFILTMDLNGCILKDSISVIVKPKIYLEVFAGNDTSLCFSRGVELGDRSKTEMSYSWSPTVGISNPFISNPTASPDKTTLYYLEVSSNIACSVNGRDSVLVESCDGNYYIPNFFSPNGDGINDFFIIKGIPSDSKVHIYNRWGEEVFNNEGAVYWDGRTPAGLECPSGVYFYLIEFPKNIYKGSIQLVR